MYSRAFRSSAQTVPHNGWGHSSKKIRSEALYSPIWAIDDAPLHNAVCRRLDTTRTVCYVCCRWSAKIRVEKTRHAYVASGRQLDTLTVTRLHIGLRIYRPVMYAHYALSCRLLWWTRFPLSSRTILPFLPRDAMLYRGICCRRRRASAHPSRIVRDCRSVARWSWVQTTEPITKQSAQRYKSTLQTGSLAVQPFMQGPAGADLGGWLGWLVIPHWRGSLFHVIIMRVT